MSKKLDKKHHIIEKGFEIIYSKGYNGTGVKEIVEAAGIPKGSFYTYFESKEDFALEAIDYFHDKTYDSIREIFENRDIPPLKRLVKIFGKACESDDCRGCFIGNLAQELGVVNTRIGNRINYLFKGMKRNISDILKEAQEKGDLNKDLDPDMMADFIWNSYQGVLIGVKIDNNKDPVRNFINVMENFVLV